METLTDITIAETTRRERARDYEIWKNEVDNLTRKVAKLSTAPNADAMKRLRQIIELADGLPGDVIGSIGGLQPVEGIARGFLAALAGSALNNLNNLDERRRTALAKAKTDLTQAEAEVLRIATG